MHFGAVPIPAAGLAWLGVAPEHQRQQGLGTHLLRAAESRMAIGGALVGMLRTTIPHFFPPHRLGAVRTASYRRADARALLARLLDRGLIPRPRRRLHIRPWLQWEQAALMRIYGQNAQSAAAPCAYGPLERTRAYWQWLLNRRGTRSDLRGLGGAGAFGTRRNQHPRRRLRRHAGRTNRRADGGADRPRAAAELLARCCGDAIEHDRHCVLLHAPPSCPLFEIVRRGGGLWPAAACRNTARSP